MNIVFRCDPALIDSLPRPVPARQMLPDWLRTMQRTAVSDAHGASLRTVKQCPPFVDAMTHGFVIPLPCDIEVSAGRLSWNWDLPPLASEFHPRAPLSFHVPAQLEGSPFHHPTRMIVKFNSFWTVELEPGWSLFAMHPANRMDLPFRLLTGLVDADRFTDVGILFPAEWTDPGFSGVLPRGTPIAQCFPVPRQSLALRYEAMTAATLDRYDETARALLSGPGIYRKRFRAKREDRTIAQEIAESSEIEE